jgi:hypothetical protein
VLLAIKQTRALRISFWGCPSVAAAFGCTAQDGHPDLQGEISLSVLGEPAWLPMEVTPWTEVLIPMKSLFYYARTAGQPVGRDIGAAMMLGFSEHVATKLLASAGTLNELRIEGSRVAEALATGGSKIKLKDLDTYFSRRKDAEMAAGAAEWVSTVVEDHRVVDALGFYRAG